ncbi:hypothetical protein V5738_10420 [Salinisphaera sp. SPP-AMP-43]|uniref:hypothetical protein n=1 Tax=Salinisphaera sp. SPP-AMP-43 TaxID=3121288 RepID=UPI003C6DDD35
MASVHALIDILRILAWPVTVLILAFVFHDRVSALLKRVSSVGYGDLSVDFDRLMAPAERALARSPGLSIQPSQSSRRLRLQQLADQAPRAAILEAWADLAETRAASQTPSAGSNAVDQEAIDALTEARNHALASGDDEIAVGQAQRYVALAHQAALACQPHSEAPC